MSDNQWGWAVFLATLVGILVVPVTLIVMFLMQTHREDGLAWRELIALVGGMAALPIGAGTIWILTIFASWSLPSADQWGKLAIGIFILALPASIGGSIGLIAGWIARSAANRL